MGLTEEQRAKLEEIKTIEKQEYEEFKKEQDEKREEMEDFIHSLNITPLERKISTIVCDYITKHKSTSGYPVVELEFEDEIQQYYHKVEDITAVTVEELAVCMNRSSQTIRNYTYSDKNHNGFLKTLPITTQNAKHNGERRYYDLHKAVKQILMHDESKQMNKSSQLKKIRNTTRDSNGKYTKNENQ